MFACSFYNYLLGSLENSHFKLIFFYEHTTLLEHFEDVTLLQSSITKGTHFNYLTQTTIADFETSE